MKKMNRQNLPIDQDNKKQISFVVVSLIVHFMLLFGFTRYSDFLSLSAPPKKQSSTPDIEFVDIAQWEKLSGELAEQKEANLKKPDPKAKFLSEKNNQVDKETKAAQKGEFKNSKSASSASMADQKQNKSQQTKSEPETKEAPIQAVPYGDLPVAQQRKPQKAKSVSDLRLNALQDMSASASQDSSQTNDYLKDVAIGAATHLNTREFLYFTYFNRIKRKLRDHWEPLIHTRVREITQSGRKVASTGGARVTRLVITLDENGGLSRVQVSTTSGLLDLDDVAIEALRVSAPFPNPPKDLIENGLVRINWDFILES